MEGNLATNLKLSFSDSFPNPSTTIGVSTLAVISTGGSHHTLSSFQPEGGDVELGCKFPFHKEACWLSRCWKEETNLLLSVYIDYVKLLKCKYILDTNTEHWRRLWSLQTDIRFLLILDPLSAQMSRNREGGQRYKGQWEMRRDERLHLNPRVGATKIGGVGYAVCQKQTDCILYRVARWWNVLGKHTSTAQQLFLARVTTSHH